MTRKEKRTWYRYALCGGLVLIGWFFYRGAGRHDIHPFLASKESLILKHPNTVLYAGPGSHYPKLWVFPRKGIPVKKQEERDHWVKIQDPENTQGWVHQTKTRIQATGIVKTAEGCTLYRSPTPGAQPMAHLERGICMVLRKETKEWFEVQVLKHSNREGKTPRGWLLKKHVWFVANHTRSTV